ncbi:hypothetical protein BHE74_00059089 [Ensete ventricosum]|nr:hypothetical protein BHE74_00059089 [Ensete ventricosum]
MSDFITQVTDNSLLVCVSRTLWLEGVPVIVVEVGVETWKMCGEFGLVFIEVRGIPNSKDWMLMQELVQRRRSVRSHPKARSKLDAMEHQNFLFSMERIHP